MIKYHINNDLTLHVKKSKRFDTLTEEEHLRLYNEVKNATLQGVLKKLVDMTFTEEKIENKVQSLLLWVLEITDDKPIGPQKIKSPGSYCDIDLDFSQQKREQVFEYLAEKYGATRASHIATFGTMGAKAAIRNGCRALGYAIDLQNKIAKHIPDLSTIQESIDASKDLKLLIEKDKEVAHIISIARKFEGLPNSLSVHASAGIISDITVTEHIPMMISTKKDAAKVISQFDMKDVEAVGLLKFDILGLKNLDVINETVKLIKKNKNIDINIDNIDVNDKGIYKLLNEGHTSAIFQFDGTAAAYLPQIRPENIDEISDLTSLLRPGPMAMGMIDQYANAKFKGEKFTYSLKDQKLIEKVWDICYRSYGLMVYQEQVIKCFTEIGGFDEIEGDNARRAMGKKLPEEMAKLKGKFSEGGSKKGYTVSDLEILYDQMAGFAEYGFNASHAVCYSVLTCQTAYLSYYYPLEFFTAALTIDSGNTDDVRNYIKAIKDRGYEIIPPNINSSNAGFTIDGDTGILFGLGAIKGVGIAVSKKIMTRKPKAGYKTLGHFIKRNLDIINSKIIESYTKAGCFKPFGYNKETILKSIPFILEFIGILKENIKYNNIFDLCNISLENYIDSCIIRKSDKDDDLSYEIDSLGLYISEHPMDNYELKNMNDPSYIQYYYADDEFITIGCLSSIEIRKTKAKQLMCKFNITSGSFSLPCIIFPKTYSNYINDNTIAEGKMVYIKGRVKEENDTKSIIINDVSGDINKYLIKKIKIRHDTKEFFINSKLMFILEK